MTDLKTNLQQPGEFDTRALGFIDQLSSSTSNSSIDPYSNKQRSNWATFWIDKFILKMPIARELMNIWEFYWVSE